MTQQPPEPFTFRRLVISATDGPAHTAVSCRAEPVSATPMRCSPFALPFDQGSFSEIRLRHVLQYLSREDAIRLCRECWRVLEPGGTIFVVAPNLEYYLERYRSGDRDLALAGLWGDPARGQAHRWGYDRRSLPELLAAAGFLGARDVTAGPASLEKEQRHLEATARKHTNRTDGEVAGTIERGRQVGLTVDDIRSDHLERYHFAAQFVHPGAEVLDCACGVGYGAYLLATETPCARVTAIDIDPAAIAFAHNNFAHDKVTYLHGDCLDETLRLPPADCVIAFEVLEHMPHDLQFLGRLRRLLKPQGTLLISSPNEEVLPYSEAASPYHVRHYTSEQLRDLLRRSGLRIVLEATQDAWAIRPGFGGRFNLAACRRDDAPAAEQFRMPRVDSPNPDAVDARDRTIGLLLAACQSAFRARAALTHEREQQRRIIRDLRAHSDDLRARSDALRAALRAQSDALRADNAALRADNAALRRDAEDLKQAYEGLARRWEELGQELERHAQALRQLQRNPVVRVMRGLKRLLGR